MQLKSDKYKTGEKALTKKEYEKILEVIDCLEDELLIKLAITTGLRREDLCGIKINNIDLDNGILTFYEAKKNKTRQLYLQQNIIQLLKKYLKTIQKRENLFDFCGRTAYRKLNRLCELANIPLRPFHALRATCIKFCQAANWTPEQVSALTGDTIRVIQEHYSTPSTMEMKEIMEWKPII